MPNILSAKQFSAYKKDGYVHLRGIIPETLLDLGRGVLNRWTDGIIQGWVDSGLVSHSGSELNFNERLVSVWNAAGKPRYSRSPRSELVSNEMYRLLTDRALLDIAEDLLGTSEISLHGIFNGRGKLPDQRWTDTPWHQDAQYYRDAEDAHVPSLWMPMQKVTAENSCLEIAPGLHRGVLHDGYDDPNSGFLGMAPAVCKPMRGVPIEMDAGDVLCFHQKTPHRALQNRSDWVRWSIDMRYEATEKATLSGRDKGLIARSSRAPSSVTSYEQWLQQWEAVPAGAY